MEIQFSQVQEAMLKAALETGKELKQKLDKSEMMLRDAVNSLHYNAYYATEEQLKDLYCDKCIHSINGNKLKGKCPKHKSGKCKFTWWKLDEAKKIFGE